MQLSKYGKSNLAASDPYELFVSLQAKDRWIRGRSSAWWS